jgi:hypothetical protein
MPRFENEHVAVLKRVMLPRLPGCYFAPEDVSAVQAETGLNQAQIEKWADNLRFRLSKHEDRPKFLRSTGEEEKVRDFDMH